MIHSKHFFTLSVSFFLLHPGLVLWLTLPRTHALFPQSMYLGSIYLGSPVFLTGSHPKGLIVVSLSGCALSAVTWARPLEVRAGCFLTGSSESKG